MTSPIEIEDEIDRLKSTIKALEEIIDNAKACFHAWESPWDMYEILMGADIKKKGKFTSRWDHSTKPSKFIVHEDGKEVYRGNYADGEKLINK